MRKPPRAPLRCLEPVHVFWATWEILGRLVDMIWDLWDTHTILGQQLEVRWDNPASQVTLDTYLWASEDKLHVLLFSSDIHQWLCSQGLWSVLEAETHDPMRTLRFCVLLPVSTCFLLLKCLTAFFPLARAPPSVEWERWLCRLLGPVPPSPLPLSTVFPRAREGVMGRQEIHPTVQDAPECWGMPFFEKLSVWELISISRRSKLASN